MRRYKRRNEQQAAYIGAWNPGELLDPPQLFGRHAPLRLEVGFGHGHFLSQMADVPIPMKTSSALSAMTCE